MTLIWSSYSIPFIPLQMVRQFDHLFEDPSSDYSLHPSPGSTWTCASIVWIYSSSDHLTLLQHDEKKKVRELDQLLFKTSNLIISTNLEGTWTWSFEYSSSDHHHSLYPSPERRTLTWSVIWIPLISSSHTILSSEYANLTNCLNTPYLIILYYPFLFIRHQGVREQCQLF